MIVKVRLIYGKWWVLVTTREHDHAESHGPYASVTLADEAASVLVVLNKWGKEQ